MTYSSDLAAHYRAVRARLASKGVAEVKPAVRPSLPLPLLAKDQRRDYLYIASDHVASLADISTAVAEAGYVSTTDMLGNGRQENLVRLRYAFFWIANKHHGHALNAIGRFANKNHSTVTYGVAQVNRRWADYEEIIGRARRILGDA